MADELYQPQVDYTSRDYTSIRSDLLALIPNFAPQWTSRDSSDFGIVLLELFAYVGDLINYQVDRAANEAFINTATQRDTVINLAKLLGYTPSGIVPATGTITIKNTGTASATAPQYSVVKSNTGVSYTTDTASTVASGATAVVNVTQGIRISGETLGTSDGTKSQKYSLANTGVFINSSSNIAVTVGSVQYTKVDYLIDYTSTDTVYSAYTDGAGKTWVQFGDGVSGKLPPTGSSITATYRYTDTPSSEGNIAAGDIATIDATGFTASNSAAFSGGANEESTDSIRLNATTSLRALNRAVSLSDYSALALKVGGIAKANAISTGFGSVALYVASSDGNALTSGLKANVASYFTGKTPPSTALSVYDYQKAYPYLNIDVQVAPTYSKDNVVNAVRDALYSLFSFDNVTFNDLVTEGDIYSTCKSVDGVMYVTINDYEKLSKNPNLDSGLYTETATLSVTAASGATSATVATSACGVFVGSKIYSVGGSTTHGAVGAIISNVTANGSTSTNTITFSSALGASIATTAVIITTGAGGTTPGSRDFSCGVDEVPVYEDTYITLNGNGGF